MVPPHLHALISRPCINSYHAGLDGNAQKGMRDTRQPKRKKKLCLHLVHCVYNLPVPWSQLNCQLQVIKYGLCLRFPTMPSFHRVQLKWRGSYDSLILSPAQSQLSSSWIIHQQGRAGVLCVTYSPHPRLPLLPGPGPTEQWGRGVWSNEGQEPGKMLLGDLGAF